MNIFSKIKFRVLPQNYLLISIPINQFNRYKNKIECFSFIIEKKEVTLIISNKNWNKIKSCFKNYKLEKSYKIKRFS